jgi:hypothetical protein
VAGRVRQRSVGGRSFVFNGRSFTVIGVAPPRFCGNRMESMLAFWLPLNVEPLIDGSSNVLYRIAKSCWQIENHGFNDAKNRDI